MGNCISSGHRNENLVFPAKKLTLEVASIRIQRWFRKHLAINKVLEDRKWRIFSSLDTQSEAEMLHLAVFMQTLIDCRIPDKLDTNISEKAMLCFQSLEEETSTSGLISQAIEAILPTNGCRTSYVNVDIGIEPISVDTALRIIDVYRNKGTLHIKTVRRIIKESYSLLLEMKNVSFVQIDATQKITVVGDLHGQLGDLLYILDNAGFPSSNHKFVFNGDFVDRGLEGVEIMCILLTLLIATPDSIYLNRGNHEDESICKVYGFYSEVISKYDLNVFNMFSVIFCCLPLFTIVNHRIFIVHGGLCRDVDIHLADLNEIDRVSFCSGDVPLTTQELFALNPEDCRKKYLSLIQNDVLWSDPCVDFGLKNNPRGCGILFGPDVVQQFFQQNDLDFIIRSHECVRSGFEMPFAGMDPPKPMFGLVPSAAPPTRSIRGLQRTSSKSLSFRHLNTAADTHEIDVRHRIATLFSASNYCGRGNEGAYVTLSGRHTLGSVIIVPLETNYKLDVLCQQTPTSLMPVSPQGNGYTSHAATAAIAAVAGSSGELPTDPNGPPIIPPLFYSVTRYFVGKPSNFFGPSSQKMSNTFLSQNRNSKYSPTNTDMSLIDTILSKRGLLKRAFELCDVDKTGYILRSDWSIIMQRITEVRIGWTAMLPSLCKEDCMKQDNQQYIDYEKFLTFTLGQNSYQGSMSQMDNSRSPSSSNENCLDALYIQRRKLLSIFRFFDTSHDGIIQLEEFRKGCEILNEHLPPDSHLTNIDHVLSLMDLKGSGSVDLNAFFETFRLLDSASGHVDGNITQSCMSVDPPFALQPTSVGMSCEADEEDDLDLAYAGLGLSAEGEVGILDLTQLECRDDDESELLIRPPSPVT